jgi:hypothetical protein
MWARWTTAVRSLSLLLALMSPSVSFTFSSTFAFQPGSYLHATRLVLHSEAGTYSVNLFRSRSRAGKQRSVSDIKCRLAAPSTDLKEEALSSMKDLFPTSPTPELRRFLNKQKGNVEKAARMYKEYMAWSEASLPVRRADISMLAGRHRKLMRLRADDGGGICKSARVVVVSRTREGWNQNSVRARRHARLVPCNSRAVFAAHSHGSSQPTHHDFPHPPLWS